MLSTINVLDAAIVSLRPDHSFALNAGDAMLNRASIVRRLINLVDSPARRARAAVSPIGESLGRRAMFTFTPDPGADFAHAFNVGDLNGQVTLGDTVGPSDTSDFYKF